VYTDARLHVKAGKKKVTGAMFRLQLAMKELLTLTWSKEIDTGK